MTRILRARNAGTGSGGIGNSRAVPGVQANIRSGSNDDAEYLSAYARIRGRAAKAISRTPIGKGANG